MASAELELTTALRPTVSREHLLGLVKEDRSELKKTNFPLTQRELAAVAAVFIGFGVVMLSVYLTMPDVDYQILKVPHNVDELRSLTDYVSGYAKDYTFQVVLGYCVGYIFMQTFMIPGTIFFSLLAGALFGVPWGLALVIFSATAGASSCFFLSKMVGRPIAYWLWPERLQFFSAEVSIRAFLLRFFWRAAQLHRR
ncbi:unnamed protein product [Calypogeia fissa]